MFVFHENLANYLKIRFHTVTMSKVTFKVLHCVNSTRPFDEQNELHIYLVCQSVHHKRSKVWLTKMMTLAALVKETLIANSRLQCTCSLRRCSDTTTIDILYTALYYYKSRRHMDSYQNCTTSGRSKTKEMNTVH